MGQTVRGWEMSEFQRRKEAVDLLFDGYFGDQKGAVIALLPQNECDFLSGTDKDDEIRPTSAEAKIQLLQFLIAGYLEQYRHYDNQRKVGGNFGSRCRWILHRALCAWRRDLECDNRRIWQFSGLARRFINTCFSCHFLLRFCCFKKTSITLKGGLQSL